MLTRIRIAPWILFWAGFLLLGIGFVANSMWASIPLWPTAVLGALTLACVLVAVAAGHLLRCAPATAALLIWLTALAYFGGFSSCVSVVLIGVTALGIGSLFVHADSSARVGASILAGLALICGAVGWLLPFHLHFRAIYVIAFLAIAIVRSHAIASMLRAVPAAWTAAVGEAPKAALLAVTAAGVASICAWLPTINSDDLSYHLALPSQLVSLGYYQMSAGTNMWAVSAWATDILQGLAWLIAGRESRGAIDGFWLALAAVLIWKLCEALELRPWLRWLAVALYASMPMTALALSGMQTEGPTAAVALGLALLIQRTRVPDRSQLLAAALLCGLLLSLKVSNLMIACPLGLWLLWRWRLPWRSVPLALALTVGVAGTSYVYAYLLTGNPVLPLFNSIFRSPYYLPTNFHDSHWDSGLHWNILWDLVFHTSRYDEGGDGSAGFVLIALAGGLFVALLSRRARPLAIVAIVALLLPLTQIQYLRYAHPAFALLIPAMLCGVPLDTVGVRHMRGMAGALVALVVGNLMFVSAGDWHLRDGALWKFLTEGRSAFVDQYAPMRRLAKAVHDRYGADARTLIAAPDSPYGAAFAGKAFVVGWYDQELTSLSTKANRDAEGSAWSDIFKRTGVNLLIVQTGEVSPGLAAAIVKYRGTWVYEAGNLELWELHSDVTGTSVPAPPKAVIVTFDASSAPPAATLLNVELKLKCKTQDIPIVVGWKISEAGKETRYKYEWATCLWDGTAQASFAAKSLNRITGVTVTAAPSQSADMGLELLSANASFRRDMAAERDLTANGSSSLWAWVRAVNARRLARRRLAEH
jgi:hypothetical protein